MQINGEKFSVEYKHGYCYVSHPRWSLVGVGPNIKDAIQDVKYSAHILLEGFSSLGNLQQNQELVNYCLEIQENPLNEDGECQCFMCKEERNEYEEV